MPLIAHAGRRLCIAAVLLAGCAACAGPSGAQTATTPLRIATGGVTGIYYAWGSAICRLVELDPANDDLACEPLPTAGSVENLALLRSGKAEFALVEASLQARAVAGEVPQLTGPPDTMLRHVASLTPELLTMVARPGFTGGGAGGDRPRAYLGEAGSGTRALVALAERLGFVPAHADLGEIDLRSSQSADALCAGSFDVVLYLVGHPNSVVQQATRQCGATLLPLDNATVNGLVEADPFLEPAAIPGGLYPTAPADTPTIGVRTTLVAGAGVPEDVVLRVSRALFGNLETLHRLHLAFTGVTLEDLAAACNTAPLHAGAERQRVETGITAGPCLVGPMPETPS